MTDKKINSNILSDRFRLSVTTLLYSLKKEKKKKEF